MFPFFSHKLSLYWHSSRPLYVFQDLCQVFGSETGRVFHVEAQCHLYLNVSKVSLREFCFLIIFPDLCLGNAKTTSPPTNRFICTAFGALGAGRALLRHLCFAGPGLQEYSRRNRRKAGPPTNQPPIYGHSTPEKISIRRKSRFRFRS